MKLSSFKILKMIWNVEDWRPNPGRIFDDEFIHLPTGYWIFVDEHVALHLTTITPASYRSDTIEFGMFTWMVAGLIAWRIPRRWNKPNDQKPA